MDRYLSTWFLMDVASTIPFEALAYFITGKHSMGLSYSLLGMLRFWRLRRVKQLFTRYPPPLLNYFTPHFILKLKSESLFGRLEKDISFSYFWIRCARLIIVSNLYFTSVYFIIYYYVI